MKMLKSDRMLRSVIAVISLVSVQIFLGKSGHFVARNIPYQGIDPYDCFAEISIHHAVQMIVALLLILVLKKLLKTDFYFQLGDVKKGKKYFAWFIAVFAVVTVALHVLMYVKNQLPDYAFPLDQRNIIGTIGFQLFLSGPSEEIIYRALPITILLYAFGKSVPISGNLTLEVLLASVLFSFAHINWSIRPFVFEVNYFQIIYAFTLGTIQGVVYQKSRSILYPILMHSFSNVLMVGVGYLFVSYIA